MGVQVSRQTAATKKKAAAESEDDSSSSSDESSDSSEDSDAKEAAATKKPAAAAAGSDDDSDDWPSEDDEDDDDDSSDDEAYKGLTGRDRWVKRAGSEKKDKDAKFEDKKKAHGELRNAGMINAASSFVSFCPLFLQPVELEICIPPLFSSTTLHREKQGAPQAEGAETRAQRSARCCCRGCCKSGERTAGRRLVSA
jgi:hypothetical protein